MTPFPQLDAEQEALVAVLSGCRLETTPAEKGRLAEEACPILTQIAQVREEIVYPVCVGKASPSCFRHRGGPYPLLVAEIIQSGPPASSMTVSSKP